MGTSQNHMMSRVLTRNKGIASRRLIANRASIMRTHRGASMRPTRQMAQKTHTQREKRRISTLENSTGAGTPSYSRGSRMKTHMKKTSAPSSTVATRGYMGTGCQMTTKATWALKISSRRKIQE